MIVFVQTHPRYSNMQYRIRKTESGFVVERRLGHNGHWIWEGDAYKIEEAKALISFLI